MQDKRLTHRLTDYWNQLRGDGHLPNWKDFDSKEFGDIWEQCCGWKVEADQVSSIVYTYEYVGKSIAQVAGKDMTGQQYVSSQLVAEAGKPAPKRAVAEVKAGELVAKHFNNFPAARILQKIDRIVKRPAIVIEEGRADGNDGKSVRFRSCLLPFGTEDGKVTHMVLGLSWKQY